MNSDQNEKSVGELCESGRIYDILEQYVDSCKHQNEPCQEALETKKSTRAKAQSSFPNLAGFCRYLGIGTSELYDLTVTHPTVYNRILAVLEDEALNSGLSASLISAYLKKRMGYDSGGIDNAGTSTQMSISFEHDVFEDGE